MKRNEKLAPFSPVFYGGEGLGMRGFACIEHGKLQPVRQCIKPLTPRPPLPKIRSQPDSTGGITGPDFGGEGENLSFDESARGEKKVNISLLGSTCLQVRPGTLFHPKPAKMLYKKLFVESMRAAGLHNQMPRGVLKFDWLVNIQPVASGQAVLKYLAPYVYRVALSDSRIEEVDASGVTYKVKPSGKER